jgi:hypothetical protein
MSGPRTRGLLGRAVRRPREPFSHASGLDLFTAAYDRLTALGVRTPRLLFADPGRTHLGADAAVVEDVCRVRLEELLRRDPTAAASTFGELAAALAAMRAHTAPGFGKAVVVDGGGSAYGTSCETVVQDRALRDIEEDASREPRLAAVRGRLDGRVNALARPSARAPATPSSTASWAPTTSRWTRTAARR